MNINSYLTKALFFSFMLLFVSSCEKDEDHDCPSNESEVVLGNVIKTIPTKIMSFEDVSVSYERGDKLLIRLNRSKFVVEEFEITFEATYDYMGERLIFCRTPEKLTIGQGDSGSPILAKDGKVIGALCYGFTGNNNQFAARAIEDLLKIEAPEESEEEMMNLKSVNELEIIKPVYFVSGIDQDLYNRYNDLDDKNSKIEYTHFFEPNLLKSITLNDVDSDYSILPGNSISVMVVSGDIIKMGGTGTASFIENDLLYGFGHSFYRGSNAIALPVYQAEMKTLIESSVQSSFKFAMPNQNLVGSLVNDTYDGILIDQSKEAAVFTVETSIKIGDLDAINNVHFVAQFYDYEEDEYHARNIPPYLIRYHLSENIEYQDYNYANAIGAVTIEFENLEPITESFEFYERIGELDFMIYRMLRYDMLSNVYDNIKSVTMDIAIVKDEAIFNE